jgi:hypothetical protein
LEIRGSAFPVRLAIIVPILLVLATAAAAPPDYSHRAAHRIVSVKVLADSALAKDETWKIDIFRAVRNASQTLEDIGGISLRIKSYDYWTPPSMEAPAGGNRCIKRVLRALASMNGYIAEVGRGESELVIGLVSEGPEGPVMPGVADYLMGTIVLKYLERRGGIPYVLLHEVLHIFGAIDLKTPGSVMSRRDPSFRIDSFTRAIVQANWKRSFLAGDFPLPEGHIAQALALYERRRALDLGEEELAICLHTLSEVKPKPVPSTR